MNNTVSIYELSTTSTIRFANKIYRIDLTDETDMSFDVSNLSWVEPFGMLVASCAIKQMRSRWPNVLFHIIGSQKTLNSNQGSSYAAQMGFYSAISEKLHIGKDVGELSGNDNYIPITELDFQKIEREEFFANCTCNKQEAIAIRARDLANVLCRDNYQMKSIMSYIIREILRNIPEHAQSQKALMCAQYWSKKRIAEIAILDEGIGIFASFQQNPCYKDSIKDDKDAVSYAIQPGISCTFDPVKNYNGNRNNDPWQNSGFGLYTINELAKNLKGSFCVVSGKGYLSCDYSNENFPVSYKGETFLQGTAIKIRISEDNLKNSEEMLKNIVEKGEKEAKNIKNAFFKASIPSKSISNKKVITLKSAH